jgi:hypothetical protein
MRSALENWIQGVLAKERAGLEILKKPVIAWVELYQPFKVGVEGACSVGHDVDTGYRLPVWRPSLQ